MYQIKVKEYADVLRKVHSLASEKVAKNHSVSIGDVDLNAILGEREKSELLKYLNTLDIKTVRVIEAVMYIGRDYSTLDDPNIREMVENANDEPDFGEIGNIPYAAPVQNPDKLVNDTLVQLNNSANFSNKDISINQIYQKSPLRDYLERAFIILGM